MKPLRSVCPALSAALEQLSEEGLRALVTRLIRSTAHEFAELPEVERCRAALASGAALDTLDAARLHELYKRLEQQELEAMEVSHAEGRRLFRQGRYAYALSLAAGRIDAEQADNLLYDMAHAFDDQDDFWQRALREARKIEGEGR